MATRKKSRKAKQTQRAVDTISDGVPYEVRRSGIHGFGVYATRRIRKGARVMEYIGERISHAEADRRFEEKDDDGHTFLFVASSRTVIDATVGGNDARYVNHSCDPNCESVIEGSRVFVDAIRDIAPGEELGYDYSLTWESTDDPEELALYACRCGAPECRGTMLDPEPQDAHRAKAKRRKKKKQTKAKVGGSGARRR
jgi:hypothetical protein